MGFLTVVMKNENLPACLRPSLIPEAAWTRVCFLSCRQAALGAISGLGRYSSTMNESTSCSWNRAADNGAGLEVSWV